jgi:CheY-like chemotaxis protein
MCDALEDIGWQVTQAENGDLALAMLQAGQVFDRLVTDVRMPGNTDGISLARHARAIRTEMPIMVMSGYMANDLNMVVSEGLGSFLAKPFPFSQLQRWLLTGQAADAGIRPR